MDKMHPAPHFIDHRGQITDILVGQPIDAVTVITCAKGAVRGQHYHRETVQWVYILEGQVKLLTRFPGEPVRVTILEKGDLALTPPLESHTMIAVEESVLLVLTRGPRRGGDFEADTYRLDVALESDLA